MLKYTKLFGESIIKKKNTEKKQQLNKLNNEVKTLNLWKAAKEYKNLSYCCTEEKKLDSNES